MTVLVEFEKKNTLKNLLKCIFLHGSITVVAIHFCFVIIESRGSKQKQLSVSYCKCFFHKSVVTMFCE